MHTRQAGGWDDLACTTNPLTPYLTGQALLQGHVAGEFWRQEALIDTDDTQTSRRLVGTHLETNHGALYDATE